MACAEPGAKEYEVGTCFVVSLYFANKLLCRQRATGSVSALPLRSGLVLGRSRRECLLACLTACPDATLAETGQVLVAAGGPFRYLGRTGMWRVV